MVQQKQNKILLHVCCGICSSYPIQWLQEQGYDVIAYFCNPNLDSKDEFDKRLEAQRTVCEHFGIDLIAEDYNHDEYLDVVKGLENEPEKGKRCDKCIMLRLKLAANKSKELGINLFTTSLVISPHKNYEKISKIGLETAHLFNIEYLQQNFRKHDGFLKTNMISKELKIYRQNYCGCEFAKR